MTADDHLLTLSEAAGALGLSIEGIRRRVRSGDLAAVKLGDVSTPAPLRIRPSDLQSYIDQHLVVHQGEVA